MVDATRQLYDVNNGSGSDSDSHSERIKAAVDQWKAKVKKKRLKLCQTLQPTKITKWLEFTDWPRILFKSQYNLIQTHEFTATATDIEPELARVQLAWGRILECCLETLESINHKDILKLWAESQPLTVNQILFQRLKKSSL